MKYSNFLRSPIDFADVRKIGVDVDAIQQTITQALESAGIDPNAGPMKDVTAVIRNSLRSAGLDDEAFPSNDDNVIDVDDVRVVRDVRAPSTPALPSRESDASGPGRFLLRKCNTAHGSRSYKLYVPSSHRGDGAPLIVLLHGCTQSPDDFAAGTRMNALAEQHGLLVAYPAQASRANRSRCWNWFQREHQQRDQGEPAIIAAITREIIAEWRTDPRRVYVAGLSAGAAMAVVLGRVYPDLYEAVGAHSGLPYGAAHDLPSALAAMKTARGAAARTGAEAAAPGARLPRTIVFHGDRDATVHSRNGAEIVAQAAGVIRPQGVVEHRGSSAGGRAYTRVVHVDDAQRPVLESWTIHGGGHGWSGGSDAGSHTEPLGPDASREMLRFFVDPGAVEPAR